MTLPEYILQAEFEVTYSLASKTLGYYRIGTVYPSTICLEPVLESSFDSRQNLWIPNWEALDPADVCTVHDSPTSRLEIRETHPQRGRELVWTLTVENPNSAQELDDEH